MRSGGGLRLALVHRTYSVDIHDPARDVGKQLGRVEASKRLLRDEHATILCCRTTSTVRMATRYGSAGIVRTSSTTTSCSIPRLSCGAGRARRKRKSGSRRTDLGRAGPSRGRGLIVRRLAPRVDIYPADRPVESMVRTGTRKRGKPSATD